MSSIKLFTKFVKESFRDVVDNKDIFIASYIAFVFVDLISSIPWEGMGYESNSFGEIVLQIIAGILSLIIVVNVILIEKSRIKLIDKENLAYAAPTYLIYTLYSSIIILAGFLCFVIPGLIAAVLLAMVPMASILIDNDSVNYFKISFKMAKIDKVLMALVALSSVILELPGIGFDFIPNWQARLGLSVIYSFLDGLFIIVLTVAGVRIFYHLKRLLNDPS